MAVRPKGRTVEVASRGLTAALTKAVTDATGALGATGKSGEVTKIGGLSGFNAQMIVAVGLGDPKAQDDLEAIRRAYGNAIRALGGLKKVAILADPQPAHLQATAMGAQLAAYSFTAFKSRRTQSRRPRRASCCCYQGPAPQPKNWPSRK